MKNYFVLSVLIMATLSLGQATVINVPADQPTIQAGVDAAQNGDTVLVASGLYTGDGNRDINLNGRSIAIIGDSVSKPRIDCEGSAIEPHIAFILESGEDSSTLIERFRIHGAYSEYEGSILIDSAAPTIRDCWIYSNDCNGISAYISTVRLDACRIEGNNGDGFQAQASGSIITDCQIYGNAENGVSIEWSGTLDISGCSIYDNVGEGIYTTTMYQSFIVRSCNITGNKSGLFWWANFPKAGGQQPMPNREEIFDVANNIIAFNDSIGIYAEYDYNEQTDSFTHCNDVYANPFGDFVYLTNYAGDPYGNISDDPLFCEDYPEGSIIMAHSPCAPAYSPCGELIGVHPVGCTDVCGDTNIDYLVNLLDITTIIRYQYGLDEGPFYPNHYWDVNCNGTISILDVTYLISNLYSDGPDPVCCPW